MTLDDSRKALFLAPELARALPGHADKILVIKALPEEEFAVVLSALQQVFPGVPITSLVFNEASGPQD
jgi:hypothetical protein